MATSVAAAHLAARWVYRALTLSHQVPEQVEDRGLQALLKSAGVLVLLAPRQFAAELQEWSGEKIVHLRNDGYSRGTSSSADGGSTSVTRSVSYQETIRPSLELNLIQEVNARPGFGIVIVGGGAPSPLFFPHHVPESVALQRASIAFTRKRLASPQVQTAVPVAPSKQVTPSAVPAVVALSTRLTVLSSRMRSSVLVSALRGKP